MENYDNNQLEFPRRIGDLYGGDSPGLSFEIFPPKTSKGDAALERTLGTLARYRPGFISCTYGAGGSTRGRTMDLCTSIQKNYGVTATSHFTCVGSTRGELLQWLSEAEQRGIGNIMALRGDPPEGAQEFEAVAGGLQYANELVALIRDRFPKMGIGVAGYPEKHLEAPDLESDLQNLKRKVDAGADAVFTQLFYDNAHFFSFRDRYQKIGIQAPLVAGIMPITEFSRIQRITQMCGAEFPADLAARLEAVQDDKQAQMDIGVEHAISQCRELIDGGVAGIHFYVLNKSTACERILGGLEIEPVSMESV